jgi:hypothetical protein
MIPKTRRVLVSLRVAIDKYKNDLAWSIHKYTLRAGVFIVQIFFWRTRIHLLYSQYPFYSFKKFN